MKFVPVRVGVAVALGALLLGLTSCSDGTAPKPDASPSPTFGPLSLSIGPAAPGKKLPIATEIATKVGNGQVTEVVLTGSDGSTVAGTMRDDQSSWVPSKPLRYDTTYTAKVTARGEDGTTQTASTTFSTMSNPGSVRVGTGLYLFDGQTYGVGMPVVVEFDEEIPASARANVEKRLFVESSPPQVGVWRWYGGKQVLYRPRDYWLPGTRLTVRSAVDGLPMGTGRYGDQDRSATVKIADKKIFLDIDNAKKQMVAYVDDKPVKTMPVSLGKPSTPSSSGNMVIMSRDYATVFDTTSEGPDGYRIDINYAERLTWGGEFIHAAPWSVADQGYNNVSHGCVNMSWENAKWVYNNTHVGDPVRVSGTEVKLSPGNGWTVWDETWDEYVKGSALPQENLATPAVPTASPSATTTGTAN